jgi:hypothetical protein
VGCGGGVQGPFSWLRPQPPPPSWRVARIPSGAELAYPAGWQHLKSDRGTTTVALLGGPGQFLGYLNVTPRQGNESLANWGEFRVDHNREEGDIAVTRLASATGLRFLTGHGGCVKDSYRTSTGGHYIEIACLVVGARTDSVIVGAATPASWAATSGSIERAISGFRT